MCPKVFLIRACLLWSCGVRIRLQTLIRASTAVFASMPQPKRRRRPLLITNALPAFRITTTDFCSETLKIRTPNPSNWHAAANVRKRDYDDMLQGPHIYIPANMSAQPFRWTT